MPIRASDEHCRLALTAAHRLSDKPANNNTDVLLASQLVISFSGLFNNTPVPATDILASQLAQHFVDYLQANANELGIAPTFRLYLDTDNVAKLIITPARCSPASPHLRRPHVLLTAINLKYVWTTTDPSPDARIHPFAPNIALPFRLLLDNVTQRFCTWQLVRRYPLIFGPWAQVRIVSLAWRRFTNPATGCRTAVLQETLPLSLPHRNTIYQRPLSQKLYSSVQG
ncbi:hypothetical protein C8F01DRAFT_1114891 [Mycena amicta]|nr:hypothetical protein C8F01DRAFT_1114891 [Mycena amicta]